MTVDEILQLASGMKDLGVSRFEHGDLKVLFEPDNEVDVGEEDEPDMDELIFYSSNRPLK